MNEWRQIPAVEDARYFSDALQRVIRDHKRLKRLDVAQGETAAILMVEAFERLVPQIENDIRWRNVLGFPLCDLRSRSDDYDRETYANKMNAILEKSACEMDSQLCEMTPKYPRSNYCRPKAMPTYNIPIMSVAAEPAAPAATNQDETAAKVLTPVLVSQPEFDAPVMVLHELVPTTAANTYKDGLMRDAMIEIQERAVPDIIACSVQPEEIDACVTVTKKKQQAQHEQQQWPPIDCPRPVQLNVIDDHEPVQLAAVQADGEQRDSGGEWLTDNKAGKAGHARGMLNGQSNKRIPQLAKTTAKGDYKILAEVLQAQSKEQGDSQGQQVGEGQPAVTPYRLEFDQHIPTLKTELGAWVNLMMEAVWNEIDDGVVNQQELQGMLRVDGRSAIAA
jgi:hypothetical protein